MRGEQKKVALLKENVKFSREKNLIYLISFGFNIFKKYKYLFAEVFASGKKQSHFMTFKKLLFTHIKTNISEE